MPEEANYELVSSRLRHTRRQRNLSLRDVEGLIDVSASTLSRIERGTGKPDLETLNKLIEWLELDRGAVFGTIARKAKSTPEQVEVLLRADRNLDARTAQTLARIFKAAYKDMANA